MSSNPHTPTPGPSTPGGGGPPQPKKRKNAAATPSLPKPKKQKLPRNLDSITARNQLPNVPAAGGISKTGQRMVKGPYKKREKKDKDGKKIPASALTAGTGPRKMTKAAQAKAAAAAAVAGSGSGRVGTLGQGREGSSAPASSMAGGTKGDEDGEEGGEGTKTGGGEEGGEGENGAEPKEDEEDDHEEEPEYTEYEWNQELSSRGRSKDELKALLDCFSEEQLQRYEVYRRSVLSRPTVKKLVGTILNQQVTQTMAFVVAGFCKVFVGEMVEKAREVMEDWGETGAIRPEHLREAQRRYKREELQRGKGVKTVNGYQRRLFCK